MAEVTINTSLIEGYDEMTPEQKVEALEKYRFNDLSKELEKAKESISKANAEAADWKRKHNALLSDEEQKKATEDEEKKAMLEKIALLEGNARKAEYSKKLLALGYDEALASETAEAIANGDTEAIFANQKIFLDAHDKGLTAKLMGGGIEPPAGGGSVTITREQLSKLSIQDRAKFAEEHPEEYKNAYGGN